MLDLISSYAEWIVGVSAALVVVIATVRKAKSKTATFFAKLGTGLETLTGRDEIRHPETGAVVVEAAPPLGMRMARMEDAFMRMADTHDAIAALGQRIGEVDTKLDAHIATCPPSPVVINNAGS